MNKEKAKAEDIRDKSNIKVYMDSLGVNGYIGAAAVLYWDGVLKRTRRMRLGSVKHHTVYEGERIGLILGVELIREEEMAEGMVPLGNVTGLRNPRVSVLIFLQLEQCKTR